MKYPPCPGNAPGPFYVVKDWCVTCDAPLNEAADLMDYQGDPRYIHHCRFHRQPETEEEHQQAINAIHVCCTRAVRYAGTDKVLLDRINDPESCDALSDLDDQLLS